MKGIPYKETILAGLRDGKTVYQIEEESVSWSGFNADSFRRAYRKIRQGNLALPALTLQEKNRGRPQADPDWLAQERKDAEALLRGEINSMVKAYCKATEEPHRVAWAKVYAEFERTGKLRLPDQDKLGWVARQGKLGALYDIAKKLVDEVLLEQQFLEGLDKELDAMQSATPVNLAPATGNAVPAPIGWKTIFHKGCGGKVFLVETAPLVLETGVNGDQPFGCVDCLRVDYLCFGCGAEWKGHPVQAPKPCKLLPEWGVAE